MRRTSLAVVALATLLSPLAALPAESAVTCFGTAPTITATPGVDTIGTLGDDVIVGTEGDDHIDGGKGKDRICGLGGNDVLFGGPGRDRISGGSGDDHILGESGLRNTLVGGPGDDSLMVYGDGDSASGNGGADFIYAYSAEGTAIRGGPGNDDIRTGIWTKLDAGGGSDFCSLATGVVPVNCETLRLYCYGGADLPDDLGSLAGLTSAPGDFDGDGETDTMYVWHDAAAGWVLHVELDGGTGIQHILGKPAENLGVVGAYDINGDGIDEMFAQVASNPRPAVGIGTLYLQFTAPYNCTLEGLQYGVGEAFFPIGMSTDDYATEPDNGLLCRPTDHTLRLFVQDPFDPLPGTFLHSRYDQTYEPNFGVGAPALEYSADTHYILDPARPNDAAAIQRAREFNCPGMALP